MPDCCLPLIRHPAIPPTHPQLMASRGVGVIELPMAQILGHFLNATEGPKW